MTRIRDAIGGYAELAGRIALLAVVYFGAARIGLTLAFYHDHATLVWPPTGIALAALVLFGLRLWPGIFIGVLVVNATTDVQTWPSLAIAAGNTLDTVVGAWLLVRVFDFRPTLERLQDVLSFLLVGALGSTLISASVGTSALWLSGAIDPGQVGTVWIVWWLGNVAGAMVFTPVVLMLWHGAPAWPTLLRRAEYWGMLVPLAGAMAWAFSSPPPGPLGGVVAFAPYPFLVWAGTRLGARGAISASFVIMAIATLGTAFGLGPFAGPDAAAGTRLVWGYGVSVGSIALTLAAVTAQRDLANRQRQAGDAERRRIEEQQVLLVERARITREMHDGLGGQLVSTLAMVERGQEPREEVAEALRQALDDMRVVIDTLDPTTTDLRVSLGMLRTRLEPALRRKGITLRWEVDDPPEADALPPEASLHLLRIIQEAVTNTLRHADARLVEVRLTGIGRPPTYLAVEIRDDGRGIPEDLERTGRGIRNMNSRVEALGGRLRIVADRTGTTISFSVGLLR